MADLAARLNAAIQEARLQKEITNRQQEYVRWTEHLWVLEQCRDELNRKPAPVEPIATNYHDTTKDAEPKRPTLHLKVPANA